MSEAPKSPAAGPDDALHGERMQRLLELDRIDRQIREFAQSRRTLAASRRALQVRLDEIAIELRGRSAARAAIPTAPPQDA